MKKMFLLETGLNDDSEEEDKFDAKEESAVIKRYSKATEMPEHLADPYYFLKKYSSSIK
jgi:hypothetical protein